MAPSRSLPSGDGLQLMNGEPFSAIRDAVIKVAAHPTAGNYDAFKRLLPTAQLFVRIEHVPSGLKQGQPFVTDTNTPVRMRYVRLANGMSMVLASCVPPRHRASGEAIATITATEILRMILKTTADGLVVSAEDDRNSWTAVTRNQIQQLLEPKTSD
jgi:hypothetical protein